MTQDLPNTRVKGIALDYAIARQEHYSRLEIRRFRIKIGLFMLQLRHTGHDDAVRDRQG